MAAPSAAQHGHLHELVVLGRVEVGIQVTRFQAQCRVACDLAESLQLCLDLLPLEVFQLLQLLLFLGFFLQIVCVCVSWGDRVWVLSGAGDSPRHPHTHPLLAFPGFLSPLLPPFILAAHGGRDVPGEGLDLRVGRRRTPPQRG